jgi:outer membrane protein assembly factor BamD (BamD/ComL family)
MNVIKSAITSLSVLLVLLFPFAANSYSEETGILLTESLQLRIADAFLAEGEYYRAITEYKKINILFPGTGRGDYVLYSIGMAYLRGEEYEQAIRSFSSLMARHSESLYTLQAHYFTGIASWKLKKYGNAKTEFDFLLDSNATTEYVPRALIAKSLMTFEQGNVASSMIILQRFVALYPGHRVMPEAEATILLLQEYQNLPEKSELLAGVLSAIIPGSGHIYAERYADGITSFLLNALFIAGTVFGVQQENYLTASLTGVVGLPFYVGNIYGAANAAKKWNETVRDTIRNKVSATFQGFLSGD